MSYFADYGRQLVLKVKQQEEETGLRECQIGAYWAIMAHFTSQDGPALASLPTGAGKTALMMLIAFGLGARRVLVVTPSQVLRKQTARKFSELDGLRDAEVAPPDIQNPQVHTLTSRITSQEQWLALSEYDVVVSLPQNVSSVYDDSIVAPPVGLFDLIVYDEAHHMRAPSWYRLLKDFQGSKQVLLTATPFRRDKRRLPGRLVYSYPLSRAMSKGIYHPVAYEPVVSPSPATRNADLCEKAATVLRRVRGENENVQLLIRTDSVDEAIELEALYQTKNISVETVHSRRTDTQNEETLRRLRDGELDGVVGVGMLGEGLDVASLKIAVFHAPPRSFPFTIQLIGRVARPTDGYSGQAIVIADPSQLRESGVEEEVRRLYRADQGWKELIPELVEQVAGTVLQDVRLTNGITDLLLDTNAEDLRPFFSSRLYRVQEDDLALSTELDLGEDIGIYRLPSEDGTPFLGLITETLKTPVWATRTGIETVQFDLHLFYYHRESKTLFECTTSELLAGDIRSKIVAGTAERLGGDELVRTMQSPGGLNYVAAGLANAVGPTSAIPSYKMFLGRAVQGAINPSDARVFVRGHLFAKMGANETRGISDGQGRVWAAQRGSISEFISWCSEVGNDLIQFEDATTPKDFAFFGQPVRQRSFPNMPILAMSSPELELVSVTLFDLDMQGPGVALERVDFELDEFLDAGRQELRVRLIPTPTTAPLDLTYDLASNLWSVVGEANLLIRVDDGHEHEDLTLERFLTRYAPWFYMPDGGVLRGGFLYSTRASYDQVPLSCKFPPVDWNDCDILVEYETDDRKATDGKKSVQDWLQHLLESADTAGKIIFKDHGRGEAADFVTIDPASKVIELYHCKSCPKYAQGPKKGQANIGASIAHVKEVIDQVIRSNVWAKTRELLIHIRTRNEGDNETKFIVGEDLFETIERTFVPAEWKYQVFIVNPGLDFDQARNDENTNVILLTCYEWLKATDTDLRIIGFSGAIRIDGAEGR